MSPTGHVMILASAGSGKTYALTNRYVGLLARGAQPERIAALTFTRKAAGEFFDEILKKLAGAAADETVAKRLAGEIGVPGYRAADFRVLLRTMTDQMHRLSLGTLDGFFARVVRAFPLELGLSGDFELLEDHAAQLERRRVLRRMFAHSDGGTARQDFIEAFKRATFGTEEKRLGTRLDEFLDSHAEAYLAAPLADVWGRAERIWPEGCAWLTAANPARRAAAVQALHAALPWSTFNDKQRARWEDFFSALPEWAPGAPLPKPVGYVLGNAFEAWPGVTEITVERKKVSLAPAASRALRDLVSGIVGAELARRLEMTQGIFSVLQGYESVYDDVVRRAGRLTFADVQRLLRPDTAGGARILTREAAETARLFIDWRLDARIDHWLLDEFQDTSFGQWSVLRNLVDEAVQDPAGARSFFYVGDVKQAIFAWREGDARLFREIFDHYNAAAPGTIREERLDRSWRSGPAVIAMVNRVLGDGEAQRRLFPAEAVDRWQREWRDHESARPELGGFAALLQAEGEEGRFAETLRILRETRALARGLTVAVLVQKNSTAAALADYLRREGSLPATAESDVHVGMDNPLSCALLALLRAAAHPADRSAWEHIRMTPLPAVLREAAGATEESLTRRVLEEIHADGFARTIETWLDQLQPSQAPDDQFSQERGRQLVEAARRFDESGSRDVTEFIQFVSRHTVRDADTAAVVRVMTVHKAKGLGFDLVILPDLEGTKLAARRRGLAIQRSPDRAVEWVLDLPPESFYGQDKVLSAHVAAAEAEACYEELALLYVAMTRAKRAMYLVVEPVGTSKSHNFPRLLQETLGESWSAGDPRWPEALPAPPAATVASPALPWLDVAPVSRRPTRTPSAMKSVALEGGQLFGMERFRGTEYGKMIHGLLAAVDWMGESTESGLIAAKQDPVATQEALACLRAPQLASIWEQPPVSRRHELWRERAFEAVIDGAWISGVFDRVVVWLDASGQATRAVVFDYKTDRIGPEGLLVGAKRHYPQMNLYRSVVMKLTGLPSEAVACELVFTHLRQRHEVPPEAV